LAIRLRLTVAALESRLENAAVKAGVGVFEPAGICQRMDADYGE
jgi:hypothetical protein